MKHLSQYLIMCYFSNSCLSDDFKLPDNWSNSAFEETVERLGLKVKAIQGQVCETLLNKYSNAVSCDGQAPIMNERIIEEVKTVHAIFEELDKVLAKLFRYSYCPRKTNTYVFLFIVLEMLDIL